MSTYPVVDSTFHACCSAVGARHADTCHAHPSADIDRALSGAVLDLLHAAGMTRDQLGDRIGLTADQLDDRLTCRTSFTVPEVFGISAVFEVPMAFLCGEPNALDGLLDAAWATFGRGVVAAVPGPVLAMLRGAVVELEACVSDGRPSTAALLATIAATDAVRRHLP